MSDKKGLKEDHLKLFSIDDTELPLKVIKDNTVNELAFNVMPNRQVKEKLITKEYRIWNRYIEVIFDRQYFSQMLRSPDHLIFLSAQIQFQKLIYVYMCHELGIKYDPLGAEKLKVWPTRVDCKIPRLIRNDKELKQVLFVESIEKREKGLFFATATTVVNNSMVIYGEAVILVLPENMS